ncbi:integrase core domain-containing protein [Paenibacillus larvae]|nr:IS3 family transposase [Paenibacillus larvae]MDT2302995.1 integrase core domain-containing protein [Paenibacillus larvae]
MKPSATQVEKATDEIVIPRAPQFKKSTDVTELKSNVFGAPFEAIMFEAREKATHRFMGVKPLPTTKLVMDTVNKAYWRNPGVTPLRASERLPADTSHEYSLLQLKYGFTKSMSRVSRCLDNQPIERFWGTFKAESFCFLRKHHTYEDVLKDVRNYIHYYNNYRYTERLSGLSPSE